MANELNFYGDPATDSGLTIVARVYDSAGAQVGSDVSCSEVGSLAIYVGSMPSASSGQYGVRFFAGSETTPRATGLINWNGSSEVTLAAIESLLREVWRLQGLDAANPMTVTTSSRTAGDITQTITGNGTTTSTVTRQ